MSNLSPLDESALARAVKTLARLDPDLARVAREHGVPPLWARAPGFATLTHIILEQQVSLASARACFKKLEALLQGEVTPARFLALDDDALRAAGFSRQKALYCRELARAIEGGTLDIDALRGLDDDAVRVELTRIKGIGRWTADIYLLMVLLRPDVLPRGDLALYIAAHQVKGLAARPTPDEFAALAEGWQPWRAVGARLLWHHYLRTRRAGV